MVSKSEHVYHVRARLIGKDGVAGAYSQPAQARTAKARVPREVVRKDGKAI